MRVSMCTQRLLLIVSSLLLASAVHAQKPILIRGIGDQEICLGNTLDTAVTLVNNDNVNRKVRCRPTITNVVTGNSVFARVTDTVVPASSNVRVPIQYFTNPNMLSELGTFRFVTTAYEIDSGRNEISGTRDSVVSRLFGVRKTATPYRDFSDYYGGTFFGDIPDQTIWTSYGATVVEGATQTWDPPPPQDYSGAGYGRDTLHAPLMKLDRRDEYGHRYIGNRAGDTLTSFPINLLGNSRIVVSFDFMRGTKRAYPALWDVDTLYGPEHTVLAANGTVPRAGDSLILEFRDPADSGCNPTQWHRIVGID